MFIFTSFLFTLHRYCTMKKTYLSAFLLLLALQLAGQEVPLDTLSLTDLSAFQPQAGNWMIAGGVTIDPTQDIHAADAAEPTGKKRKKKKKNQPSDEDKHTQGPVSYQDGTGILLNMNDDTTKDHLLTNWEHGDIILELETMLPKGSNSGIYLQGRYEIQLLDSWGKKRPDYGDIGGIYRNWEEEDASKMYPGKAPLTNAAKAPGLWQRMKIAFQAPRFDTNGNKIANARFVYVDLNGERIHENVEVPLPTGGPIENNEVPLGPLMIQGDHGPVAFRNIRYYRMQDSDVALTTIRYQVFDKAFETIDSLGAASPVSSGSLDELTSVLSGVENDFTVMYQGAVQTTEAGDYRFRINYAGQVVLTLGGEEKVSAAERDQPNGTASFVASLPAGTTPFTLTYRKSDPRWSPRLGWFSTDSYARPLHRSNSFLPESPETGPIFVRVDDEPRLLRAFLDFEGDKEQRLTHTIGVGAPSGVHYVYNLATGSPVCVWRGEFVNATPMWYNRGDGSFRPRGAVQYLFASPSVAGLSGPEEAFPSDINQEGDWQGQGYRIDEATGLPVFLYQHEGKTLEDAMVPNAEGTLLTRTLTFTDSAPASDVYLKLAEGDAITPVSDGTYAVDQQFYIRVPDGQSVTVRTVDQQQELVATLSASPFTYSIIW